MDINKMHISYCKLNTTGDVGAKQNCFKVYLDFNLPSTTYYVDLNSWLNFIGLVIHNFNRDV